MTIDVVRLDDEQHPLFHKLGEQEQYLRGLLWADEDIRLDPAVDASAIDPFGTGTKAFWRGFLEGAGTITLKKAGGRDYAYPLVSVRASYAILVKLLAFMQEEVCDRNRVPWPWDADGKFEWQAKGGFLNFTGEKAADAVRVLYIGETVGRESARRVADAIVQWMPRRIR